MQLVAEGHFPYLGGFELIGNAELSLNHEKSRAPDNKKIRDYSGTVSIEKSFDNPQLLPIPNGNNSAPISLALSGELKRLESIKAEIGTMQLKLDIPLFPGFSLPISGNWSSRSETSSSDELRINVGVNFDLDKLSALDSLMN